MLNQSLVTRVPPLCILLGGPRRPEPPVEPKLPALLRPAAQPTNHPSGVAEPSKADELLTAALKSALALVEVGVTDHLVVAGPAAGASARCTCGLSVYPSIK